MWKTIIGKFGEKVVYGFGFGLGMGLSFKMLSVKIKKKNNKFYNCKIFQILIQTTDSYYLPPLYLC